MWRLYVGEKGVLLFLQWLLSCSGSQDLSRVKHEAELDQADLCHTGDLRTGLQQLQQETVQADRSRLNPSDCKHMGNSQVAAVQPLPC